MSAANPKSAPETAPEATPEAPQGAASGPAPGSPLEPGASPFVKAESRPLRIESDYTPAGDQPQAIDELVEAIARGERDQVLLGVTGSGKTFTMAHAIQRLQRPALVLAPNKTLAAQLYTEMTGFFPDNSVEYFVSLLRLLPARGLRAALGHLHRKRKHHQRADRPHAPLRDAGAVRARRRGHRRLGVLHLRHRRAGNLCRDDVLQSGARRARPRRATSCSNPWWSCSTGATITDFHRGTFRVRGDTVEIFPPHLEDRAWRLSCLATRSRRSTSSIR